MADKEPHSLASTFPNPPSFWKDFTREKIARIQELRSAHSVGSAGEATSLRVPNVPDHLTNLQPPPEPVDGRWRVFGDQYMLDDKLPTLEEQGIANLPATGPPSSRDAKHYDGAFELKRLVKSLLFNFLELCGTLARSPAGAEAKIQDLRTLFINMHHVLNEYRPHQARESAIEMIQEHLNRTRAETVAIRNQVDKTRRVLEGLGSLGGGMAAGGGDTAEGDAVEAQDLEALAMERDMELWASTDVAFGQDGDFDKGHGPGGAENDSAPVLT